MSYSIIIENESELAECEAREKGYRTDVKVIIEGRRFPLYITDITRLHQDVDAEMDYYGYYETEPNTVIVKEVSKVEIERTIEMLYKLGFFDRLGYNNNDED
ncbi:MAG: hypothetical protein K5662_06700 [Lachnospiraceae bacterium]|nr:hypothetical protein [Lachnospiraceae bacterium]